MGTVLDLINASYRSFGFKSEGMAIDAYQAANGLEALNDLLEVLNNDGQMVYTINRNVFPLTPGKQTYSLGVGGDFNIPRPPRIERMSVLLTTSSPNMEIPIDLLDDLGWQDTTIKNLGTYFPTACYPDGNFPLNNLNFWPYPSAACSAVLYVWNVISSFSNVNQTVSFPFGYREMLKYMLAIRLAPECGFEVSSTIHALSANARASIRGINYRPARTVTDPILYGSRNMGKAIKSQGLVVD